MEESIMSIINPMITWANMNPWLAIGCLVVFGFVTIVTIAYCAVSLFE